MVSMKTQIYCLHYTQSLCRFICQTYYYLFFLLSFPSHSTTMDDGCVSALSHGLYNITSQPTEDPGTHSLAHTD